MDDLTEENSQFILDDYDEDQPIIDQYALRKVKILETYKNKTNQSDSVIEPAAIKENQLYPKYKKYLQISAMKKQLNKMCTPSQKIAGGYTFCNLWRHS